jgi:hypothetical protein
VKSEMYPLATPLICPFCHYEGLSNEHTNMRMGKEPNTHGLRSFSLVEWQCPSCSMWITEEDEETI